MSLAAATTSMARSTVEESCPMATSFALTTPTPTNMEMNPMNTLCVCPLCGFSVRQLAEFERHMLQHNPSGTPPAGTSSAVPPETQTVPPLSANTANSLPRVNRKRSSAKSNVASLEQLHMTSLSPSTDMNNGSVDSKRRYRCNQCQQSFPWYGDLRSHMHTAHPQQQMDPSRSSCSSSVTSSAASTPQPSVSTPLAVPGTSSTATAVVPPSPYRCTECKYVAKYRSELLRHLRLHKGMKPFVCKFCSYRSSWKGDLKRHLESHHPDFFASDVEIRQCMAQFKNNEGTASLEEEQPGNMSDGEDGVEDQDEMVEEEQSPAAISSGPSTLPAQHPGEPMKVQAQTMDASTPGQVEQTSVDIPNPKISGNPSLMHHLASMLQQQQHGAIPQLPTEQWKNLLLQSSLMRMVPGMMMPQDGNVPALSLLMNLMGMPPSGSSTDSKPPWLLLLHLLAQQQQQHQQQQHQAALSSEHIPSLLKETPTPSVHQNQELRHSQLTVSEPSTSQLPPGASSASVTPMSASLLEMSSATQPEEDGPHSMSNIAHLAGGESSRCSSVNSGSGGCLALTPNKGYPSMQQHDTPSENPSQVSSPNAAQQQPRSGSKKLSKSNSNASENYCKPYRCSACGHRSNWKWDINKHIKVAHTTRDDIVTEELSPEEARRTYSAYQASDKNVRSKPHGTSGPSGEGYFRPYQCPVCGQRSNWKWDIKKHIKLNHGEAHADQEVISLDTEFARQTIKEYMQSRKSSGGPGSTHGGGSNTPISMISLLPATSALDAIPSPLAALTSNGHFSIPLPTATVETPGTEPILTTPEDVKPVLEESQPMVSTSPPRTIHKCSTCSFTTRIRSELQRHIRRRHGVPAFDTPSSDSAPGLAETLANSSLVLPEVHFPRVEASVLQQPQPPITEDVPLDLSVKSTPEVAPNLRLPYTLVTVGHGEQQQQAYICSKCASLHATLPLVLLHCRNCI